MCFKEPLEVNVRYLVKDNLPISFYEHFLSALKEKKIDAIFELNNLKEIQEYFGDTVVELNTWFDEKLWFHGNGKEMEYIELCKDNKYTTRSSLEAPIPIIQAYVLDKAKEEDAVITSIKGTKPIFTTFELYDYGDDSEPKVKRIDLEEVMDNVYNITLFQRDF